MPLKPVFDKAPLTMLTSQPLRAGQVRVNLPALTRLYAQVENRREPMLLEGAFRLASLVKADAMQSPAAKAIYEAADAQREDGSFALTIEDSVYVLRAVWALYEAEAKKEDLTVLLRWFQWAAKQWDDVIADEYVRAFPADLLELLEKVYRITGVPAMLKLARRLSESTMNWSSVLMATPIQTPVGKTVTAEELNEGLKKENGDLEGYYTRLSLTTNASALADGVRASLARGWLSGSATEMNAAKTGWEKLSRYHGAICGGLTANPMLAGGNPSTGLFVDSLGAWAEAFACAGMGAHAVWAWDELERLVFNALPASVEENRVQMVQRVNVLTAQDESQDTFALTLGRLSRGYALAMQSAVTAWADGFAVNMLIPGKYAVCDNKMVLTIDAQGERYTIKMHMKNDQKATFHMRLPAWAASSEILVNGAQTAEYRLVDGCIGIERTWHDGDEIVAVLEQPVMRHNSFYHQATYLTRGPQVLAISADGDWAYALCGNGKMTESGAAAPFAPIAWKKGNAAPVDVPVLPELTGEIRALPLKPYAETPVRIALFPRGDKA